MKNREQQILMQHRLDQARASLEEANILFAHGKTTIGAVNRAYYAMFYAVIALLQQVGKIPRKHSGAIGLFDSEFVKKGLFPKELSHHLHRAFESRQISDYHAVEPISREDTQEILRNAKGFVQAIDKYLK